MDSAHGAGRRSNSIDISNAIELTHIDSALWTPSASSLHNTGYAPIQEERESDSDNEPLKPNQHTLHHWETVKPRFWKTILIQLFAFLWLAPVAFLLILNIKGHIIGASAWCPGGRCYPAIYAGSTFKAELQSAELPAKYDRETHNLVGGLQFVAKALEVWFILIATWLVYLVTAKLAATSSGLPIGYLTRPSEFDKIPGLFDPLLWSTLRRLPSSRSSPRRARRRIWLFVGLTIALCAICNLMGPAVAVLLIPTLQWKNTRKHLEGKFAGLNSNSIPSADGFALSDEMSCTATNFSALEYSCARHWAASLDSWIEGYGASQDNGGLVISYQDRLSFTYNTSVGTVTEPGTLSNSGTFEMVAWSPSRQVLHDLNDDLNNTIVLSSNDYPSDDKDLVDQLQTYIEVNNTVQTFLNRNGPILGSLINIWLDFDNQKHWTSKIDTDRWVRCYEAYNLSNSPLCWGECGYEDMEPVSGIYTKCIPLGTGWNNGFKARNFTIDRQWYENERYYPEVEVTILATGKAGYVASDGRSPILPERCFDRNADLSSCDWSLLWEAEPDPDLKYRSNSINTIEMSWNTSGLPGSTSSKMTLVIDFVALQSFATYTLDPSVLTNPFYTASWALQLPENATLGNTTIVPVEPAWTLAAWAATAGGSIATTRSVASELRDVLRSIRTFYDAKLSPAEIVWGTRARLSKVALMPIVQTLSLIDYNTIATTATRLDDDSPHPLLYRYSRINVYAYGLASRTSWVGVIVTSIGCIIVIAEVVLGLQDRRRFRSLTQLLVAALEHTYQNEFPKHMHHDEKNIARVLFKLDSVPYGAGKFKFEKRV
ncbi:hypothetical protein PRZ48_012882 [Zasmidium cellare]|uniref:Uncharacterized protein n=1 Tax=Zasmidium cellare TaxID=395010 RepID=A0ABR0E2Q5_ZASCE|nr:hypothetical protein PRZ48_012882 [Zasmidium cellare]